MKIGFVYLDSRYLDEVMDGLQQRLTGHEVVGWPFHAAPPATDFEVLLVQGTATRECLTSQRKLRLIQTVSAGYEGVDVDAATELGIPVSYAPSEITGNGISVAEWAIALMICASRQLNRALQSVHDPSSAYPQNSRTLFGSTVCIAGFGSIGRLLAERLQVFGVRILATTGKPERVPDYVQPFPPDQLATATADADFVVLCMRADKSNENLIDAAALKAMKRGAVLINIARGLLVDEEALFDAVKSGQISAAGLDVLQKEPADPSNPLLTLPEVLITPHVAGLTKLTMQGTLDYVGRVIDDFAGGKLPTSVVNPPEHKQPI